MTAVDAIIFFLFGTIVGSFLNVLVLRYNTGLSFVTGRSRCFSCGRTLGALDLIPVASFIALNGRCRGCKSRISIQYPAVEAATGLLFAGLFLVFGLAPALPLELAAAALLVAIAVYDWRHMIIPDGLVACFIALGFAHLIFFGGIPSAAALVASPDFWAGPMLAAFFAALWLVSGGRWMGFGDAKLALGVGWLLGFSGGVFAITAAFWAGAIWGIIAMALGKTGIVAARLSMRSEIPFAPFIIAAVFLQLLTGWNLSSLFILSLSS